MTEVWRKCSSCKKDIALKAKYYECSASACTGKRKGYVFCSMPCFEVHLPAARHKDPAAIERQAPSAIAKDSRAASRQGQRRMVSSPPNQKPNDVSSNEVLIVVSKLKKYVQDQHGMNTSQSVSNVLSDKVRRLCDEAVQEAEKAGRRTLMDRDFR